MKTNDSSPPEMTSMKNSPFIARFYLLVRDINPLIYMIYGLFSVLSIVLLLLYEKNELHLIINAWHSNFWDVFFKYVTYLGDGVVFGVLFFLFLLYRRRMAWVTLLGGILTLAITQFLKKVVFAPSARPFKAIGEEALHLIDGVPMLILHSFPSGHTTAAFTAGFILCYYSKKTSLQLLWLVLAFMVAFSRVYLSQHYWQDIFAGSFLGICIATLSMLLIPNTAKQVNKT